MACSTGAEVCRRFRYPYQGPEIIVAVRMRAFSMLHEGLLPLLSLNLIAAESTFSLQYYKACLKQPLVDETGRYFPNHTKIDGRDSMDCHGDRLIRLHSGPNGGPSILGKGKVNGSTVYSGYTSPDGWSEGEDVAVKRTLIGANIENTTLLERFRQEICLLKSIRHPSIPLLRCAYVKSPWFFQPYFKVKLVMQRISGGNLKLMSEQQLKQVDFKVVFEAITGLFTFLHSAKISYNGKFSEETVIYNRRELSTAAQVMFTGWGRVTLVDGDSEKFAMSKKLDWTAVQNLVSWLRGRNVLTNEQLKEIGEIINSVTLESNNID